MKVKQVYNLVNTALTEAIGEQNVLKEDLTNIVDMGDTLLTSDGLPIYNKNLINKVWKEMYAIRKYSGRAPSVFMDGSEYGSILQKVTFELRDAEENESWELTAGASYDPNIFYDSTSTTKYFNSKTTFEVPISITEEMIKQSFRSYADMNAFLSGLWTYMDNTMTLAVDNLVMRTINNMIATTIYDEYKGTDVSAKSGVRAVNVLKLYNDEKGTSLPATESTLKNPDFLRFLAYIMDLKVSQLARMSTIHNIEGKQRFTPREELKIVGLDRMIKAADVYLQSDVWHNEMTKMPSMEQVSDWQGTGKDFSFNECSKIHVVTSGGNTVEQSGILGIMFDRYALGVLCTNERTTTNYNGKAEFTNYWSKRDAQYFNDTSENFIVLFMA